MGVARRTEDPGSGRAVDWEDDKSGKDYDLGWHL
jgi:hypothetical protein